jgi:hypothetical protein
MPGRTRRLVVLTLALVVLTGLVVADVVTLTKARPSFVHETRDVENLIKSTTTTTVAPRRTTGTTSPASIVSTTGPAPSTTSPASTTPRRSRLHRPV